MINFLFRSPPWGVPWLPIDSTHHLVKTLHHVPPLQDVQREGQHGNDTGPCNAKRSCLYQFILGSSFHHWKWSMFHLNPSTIPQKEHKLGIEDMFAYLTTKYRSIEEAEWEQPLPSSCDVSSNISREATSCIWELLNNNSNRVNLRLQASNFNQCWWIQGPTWKFMDHN